MLKKAKKKKDIKSRVIKRQMDEIESLKETISHLQISCEEKDSLIGSIDLFRRELDATVSDLKAKGLEYDKLIGELLQMKKVMNEEVFKGRWNIVRFLLK